MGSAGSSSSPGGTPAPVPAPRGGSWSLWPFGRRPRGKETAPPIIPVARFRNVAISREAGAGGGAIARLAGSKLGWKVYDHELLEAIAQRMGLPADEVRTFDELAPSVVQDWLLPLREEHYAPRRLISTTSQSSSRPSGGPESRSSSAGARGRSCRGPRRSRCG